MTQRPVKFDDSVRELFEPFLARRLLSTTADGAFVSVAHEAFLVNWKPVIYGIGGVVMLLEDPASAVIVLVIGAVISVIAAVIYGVMNLLFPS
jgi:hypothetical protein